MGIWPFGSKGGGAGPPRGGSRSSPNERVKELSSQGLSEPEIIRALKDEGYSPIQVDSAMRNVLKESVGGPQQKPMDAPLPGEAVGRHPQDMPGPTGQEESEDLGEPPRPPMPEFGSSRDTLHMPALPGEKPHEFREEEEKDEEQPIFMPPKTPYLTHPPTEEGEDEEIEPLKVHSRREAREDRRRAIEELVESIVDEKWSHMRSELGDVEDRFHEMESKIMELQTVLDQIRGEKKSELQDIDTKIDSYKQSISEISERMESIEQAMKDSLTPMLQSLRSLSDTIKTLKNQQ